MEELTDKSLIVVGVFILVVELYALVALVVRDEAVTTPKQTELPVIPMSANNLKPAPGVLPIPILPHALRTKL